MKTVVMNSNESSNGISGNNGINSQSDNAQTAQREAYVKPTIEVYEMEVEEGILQSYASDFGNGGVY